MNYKKEYKQLKTILKKYNTGIFGAETNYSFVKIADKNTFYKWNIRTFNLKRFNYEMDNNYIFNRIVDRIIEKQEQDKYYAVIDRLIDKWKQKIL